MTKSLIVAGGCFWCVEHDLHKVPGVISVTSGYSGGETENPTYEDHHGHREVVLVEYDDEKTLYTKLLQFFLDHIDPTDQGGQFGDRGESYKAGIFYESEDEKKIAEDLLTELNESKIYDKPAFVDVLLRKPFYKAEEYHQNYAEKNSLRYGMYRQGSGREAFVNQTCTIREDKKIPWKD